jgi:hypothetical protein
LAWLSDNDVVGKPGLRLEALCGDFGHHSTVVECNRIVE